MAAILKTKYLPMWRAIHFLLNTLLFYEIEQHKLKYGIHEVTISFIHSFQMCRGTGRKRICVLLRSSALHKCIKVFIISHLTSPECKSWQTLRRRLYYFFFLLQLCCRSAVKDSLSFSEACHAYVSCVSIRNVSG